MAQRKLYRQTYKKDKKKQKAVFTLRFLTYGLLFFIICLFSVFFFFAKDLPRPENFTEKHSVQSTKIYDRTGEIVLYDIYDEEKREIVSLDKIPDYLKNAVIATEDAKFYKHFGLDIEGIIRSILINLKIAKPTYGGSTLPQQLIRSTFFSLEKTAERKIREIILALELDRRYSKEQILEWYLNQVPFGQNTYGVEAASQTYFQKSVSEISVPEAAVLAALIQRPSAFSPYGPNKDLLLARKDHVLDRMVSEGYISKEEGEEFKKEVVEFNEKPIQIKAPYFTLWIKQQLEEKYGVDFLERQGLKVYSSLDWEAQEILEKAVKEGVERNKGYLAYNAGAVVVNPKTGEVLAMSVGTGDYYASPFPEECVSGVNCLFDPKFNVVVGTKNNPGRQPGSAFKPFIYATAFENGYNSSTTVTDEETNFGVWGGKEYIPQNYDGLFRGEVTLRQGIAQSLNIPSIKTLYLAGTNGGIEKLDINDFNGKEDVFLRGLERSIQNAKDMGITTLTKPLSAYGPAIVLGGGEVKLLDITSAYGVFATEGLSISPVSILKIEDANGNIIEENKKMPKRVLSSEVAKKINDVLSDNKARTPMFGPVSALYFKDYDVAVKTGTTQDYRDAWTIGYCPSFSVGVWVGNNNNEAMLKKPAVSLAGPIFHAIMENLLLKNPKESFNKPLN